MSNASIVERIELLMSQLEAGEITPKSFAQQFESHFSALENMEYVNIKAAQMVSFDMATDVGFYDEGYSDIKTVADIVIWVREWLRSVPR